MTEAENGATETRKRNVEYGVLAEADAIPDAPAYSRGASPLQTAINARVADTASHGKAAIIARYDSKTACAAAVNVLRQRLGRHIGVSGSEFAARRDGDKHVIWMVHDPKRIVEGEWERHKAAEKARIEKLVGKRKAKEAAKAAEADQKAAEAPGKAPEGNRPGKPSKAS